MVMIKVLGERLYQVYLITVPIPRLLPFLFDLLFLIWTTNINNLHEGCNPLQLPEGKHILIAGPAK